MAYLGKKTGRAIVQDTGTIQASTATSFEELVADVMVEDAVAADA